MHALLATFLNIPEIPGTVYVSRKIPGTVYVSLMLRWSLACRAHVQDCPYLHLVFLTKLSKEKEERQ